MEVSSCVDCHSFYDPNEFLMSLNKRSSKAETQREVQEGENLMKKHKERVGSQSGLVWQLSLLTSRHYTKARG